MRTRPLSREGAHQPVRSLVARTSGTKEEGWRGAAILFPAQVYKTHRVRDNIGEGDHSRSQTLNHRLTNSLFLRTNLNEGRSTVNPLNCPRTVFCVCGSNQLLLRSSGTKMDGNVEGIDDDDNDDDNRDNGTDDSSFRTRKECTN